MGLERARKGSDDGNGGAGRKIGGREREDNSVSDERVALLRGAGILRPLTVCALQPNYNGPLRVARARRDW